MRLRQALLDKFPDTAADDVLKVVGNLLYYRYMNPAIVAPDAFDIIDMGVDKRALETEQRRNLGAIAKVLQHAAAGKLVRYTYTYFTCSYLLSLSLSLSPSLRVKMQPCLQ